MKSHFHEFLLHWKDCIINYKWTSSFISSLWFRLLIEAYIFEFTLLRPPRLLVFIFYKLLFYHYYSLRALSVSLFAFIHFSSSDPAWRPSFPQATSTPWRDCNWGTQTTPNKRRQRQQLLLQRWKNKIKIKQRRLVCVGLRHNLCVTCVVDNGKDLNRGQQEKLWRRHIRVFVVDTLVVVGGRRGGYWWR